MPRVRLATDAAPNEVRDPGKRTTSEFDVPLGATHVAYISPRVAWPVRAGANKDIWRCEIWMSYNNGLTWDEACAMNSAGGDLVRTDGTPVPDCEQNVTIREPRNSRRKVRVVFEQFVRFQYRVHIDAIVP